MDDHAAAQRGETGTQARSPGGSAKVAPGRRLRLLGEGLAVILLYLAVVVVFLWPLVENPIDRVYAPDHAGKRADLNLILWILAWDWHALTSEPLALFDANIHHPALRTLAGSEHMLGVLPLSGPAYAISGNPIFAYTTALVLSLALSGAAMYALLRHWGVVRAGALFGGFVYALYPGRTHGGSALQLLSVQYLPLALIFLDRTLRSARLQSAIAFAALLLWQMLCSVYLAFMAVVSLSAYGVVVLLSSWRSLKTRGVGLAIGAALAAGVALLAIHTPYLAQRSVGLIPEYGATDLILGFSSGVWRNWLLPPIALREWGYRTVTGLPSYLGALPMAAAGCTLVWRRRESTPWAAPAAFVIALVGYLFALGPYADVLGHRVTLPYGYLSEWVPGFSSMRVPSRFAVVTMTGVSALAGIGLGRALETLEAYPRGRWLAAGVVALMLVGTSIEYDLPFDPPAAQPVPVGDGIPPVYNELAALPEGPLLEIPFGTGESGHGGLLSSWYMYYSTFHWHRLLNGHTGYEPPSAQLIEALSRALPDSRALEILGRTTDVRYLVVHLSNLPPVVRRQWLSVPSGLRLVDRFGFDLLFEVAERVEPDLLPAMRDVPSAGHTILGTPIEPVPKTERRASVHFTIPPPERVEARSIIPIEVEVRNRSATPWPALAVGSPDLVAVDCRWVREGAGLLDPRKPKRPLRGRLPYDLLPGESVRVRFSIRPPRRPGPYTLVVGLRQSREWFEDSLLRRRVAVELPERSRP